MHFSHRRGDLPRFSKFTLLCVTFGFLFFTIFFPGSRHQVVAAEPSPEKVTYDDHVRPIFRQHCLSCHSADTKRGDLAIDAFATTIEGGASGEVVVPGDLESSRLWELVSHQDEPAMPPAADKLSDDKLALIRRWIEGGALENSGSVSKVKKKQSLAMLGPVASGKPEGPAAMPESMFREPVVYSAQAGAVTAVVASPWAPVVAVAGQRQVCFYHSDTAKLLGIVAFPEGLPQILAFSRDGSRLLVAGGRGASIGLAAIYDVKTGSRLLTVGDEYDSVRAADLNAQQTLVALGGPMKVVRVFHAADNSLAFEIRKHTDWITAIAFSPDGKILLTGDRGGGALLWEAETGREVASLRGHAGAVTSASWRADSQVVATSGADGTIRLWDREEGKQVKSWTAHAGGVTSVCFARDGRLVSTGRDRMVKLWKADGGHLKDLTKFDDIGLATCITHEGKRVVAGDFLGTVRLIDIESGQQVGLMAPNPPTLAMRLAVATAEVTTATQALAAAEALKLKADKATSVAQTEAAQKAAAVAESQDKVAKAQSALEAAGQEQRAFATAMEHFAAAIDEAKKKTAAQAEALAAAVTQKQQADTDLQTRQAAAEASAKKLAAAQAEFDKLKAAAEESRAVVQQKVQAVTEAERAHRQAVAAVAQAQADREMFKKTEAVRSE